MDTQQRDDDTDLQRGFEPLRTIFAIVVLLLGFAAGARGEDGFGALSAQRVGADPIELPALTSDVHVEVFGMVAEASIRQRFSNSTKGWIEAQYLLPLPVGAVVHDLQVRVGDRLIVGEIREKERARADYVEAAASGRRAALVESERAQLFRTAVANVGPGETIEVEVRWWQTIAWRDQRFTFSLPLTYTPRYRAPTIAGNDANPVEATSAPADLHTAVAPLVSIRVDLDAGLDLIGVDSPSHALSMSGSGARRAIVLADGAVAADRDFVLEWIPKLDQAPASALLTEQRGGDTYALLMLLPRKQQATPLPRELILVIDTSGSMEGESIRQARAALDLALLSLGPADRFNVIAFNSQTTALFDTAVPARPDDVRLARDWVAVLRAEGGTEMVPALQRALAGPATPGFVRQVVFATDGAVDDARALYAVIETQLDASRLFVVGIGSAPNAQFIERAATLGRGSSIVVRSTHDVETRMRELFDKLDRPALRDLQLAWPGAAETYPRRLPDLYAGEPLLVVTRLAAARGTVQVSGAHAAAPWSTAIPLDRGASAAGIARLWAQRKIDALEQSIDGGVDASEVRAAVLPLALEHHLVTRYTSLLAVEKTPARDADADLASTRIANGVPAGSLAFAATATSAPRSVLLGLALLALAGCLAARRPRIAH